MVPIAGSSILYSAAMTWQYSGERPGGRLLLVRLIGVAWHSKRGRLSQNASCVCATSLDALLGLSRMT